MTRILSGSHREVTYIKAYDEIRKLWADQPLAKQMGYSAGYFSFNSEGGRCEECKGEGTITVEMQFMADLVLECESCHGKRFKADTLEVKFEGKNIYDILEMTVNQAIEFFTEHNQKKIVKKLRPLQDVGLGYIKLGQSSSTLSGGENIQMLAVYYKHKNLRVGVGAFNPFTDNYKVQSENWNKFASYKTNNYIKESSRMFLVNFSYNFSFGRSFKTAQRKVNNSDNDSGVMGTGK